MGQFAVNVAIGYQIGAARGDHSILSAMDIEDNELFATLGQSVNDLILHHRTNLERKRETRCVELKLDRRWLEASSAVAGPKRRWVDGTPEYSLHICGLRKLFPQAVFIHLFRPVEAVVRSMLNFHRIAGIQLVANQEEAYRYWIRTVSACVMAERAYGPNVVHRIRYEELTDNPESTMRSLLDFLQEPYAEKCVEPLELRINSSTVPADFKADGDATDPAVVEKATQLCAKVEQTPQPAETSSAAVDEMEAAFRERVRYVANIDTAYQKARRIIETVSDSGLLSNLATEALEIADPSASVLSQQP